MQISSRFTMAIHIFALVDVFSSETKVTSDFMAGSIGTNPVVVRKLLQQLKAAGLIDVARGTGGVSVSKSLSSITLLDIYKAVECIPESELFHFHENPNSMCPVGRNIHAVLDPKLDAAQKAFEASLSTTTLADIEKDFQAILKSKI